MPRGGRRPGSGRKPRWGCPTTTIRVPVPLKAAVLAFIEARMQGNESVTESEMEPHNDYVTKSKPDRSTVPREQYERALGRSHQLEVALMQARQRIAELERRLEQERMTRPIWTESGGRCQARTKAGRRCHQKAVGIVAVDARGFTYEMHVCTQHLARHRNGRAVTVAAECLPVEGGMGM